MRRLWLVAACLAALTAVLTPAEAAAPAFGPARVFAKVPDPGFVALTVVGAGGVVYGGTYFPVQGNAGDGVPSRVFAWTPAGRLLHTWVLQGQDLSADHGAQTAVVDRGGRVYVLESSRTRVIRLDPRTGSQRTYATIPDLTNCTPVSTGPCTQSLLDNKPSIDYAAWGPDGSLYVTDDAQAAIFRVPPGGGVAKLWVTSNRFDGIQFGLTGVALSPDHRSIYATTVASSPLASMSPANGSLVRIPIRSNGAAGPIQTLWTSGPLDLPDGFAFGQSGRIYMALLGPVANKIVVLSPAGELLASYPSAGQGRSMPVPFDNPSSVVFNGTHLLVTNDGYFSGNRAHQVIFDIPTNDRGVTLLTPAVR